MAVHVNSNEIVKERQQTVLLMLLQNSLRPVSTSEDDAGQRQPG